MWYVTCERGWTVTVSPFYNDTFSQKPREIDIIAEKAFLNQERIGGDITIIVRLFIECKYINGVSVFWFDKKNIESAKEIVRATQAFIDPDSNESVKTMHHYLRGNKVVKLFESDKEQEKDPIFKAMTQSLNSLVYYRDQRTSLYNNFDNHLIAEINYPVIICNSFENFFEKNVSRKDDPIKQAEPFQLEINYAYYDKKQKPVEELFYIDVIQFSDIEKLEQALKHEAGLAKQKIRNEKDEEGVANFFKHNV